MIDWFQRENARSRTHRTSRLHLPEDNAMLTMGFVTDPDHWRERAENMRLTASSLKDENAKARMLKIAEGYEALRRQTEERIADERT